MKSENIGEYGEFNLIKKISSICNYKFNDNEVGIGDDCSVVIFDENYFQITTTDLLIEDIHFIKHKIDPEDLGQKCVEVNVSDIAAMGGFPEVIYLSMGLPKSVSIEYFDRLIYGIKKACDKYNIKLMGGDTTQSPGPIILNILVQGKVEIKNIKLRSMAKLSDIICVVGDLGDSGIGLKTILEEGTTKDKIYFINKHNVPLARLKEARWLSQFEGVHAMMDISDGLASDLKHICNSSQVGAQIELFDLPISIQAKEIFKENLDELQKVAICSGEDYALLLTLSEECYMKINNLFENEFNSKLVKIGMITKDSNISYLRSGKPTDISYKGYDHFTK